MNKNLIKRLKKVVRGVNWHDWSFWYDEEPQHFFHIHQYHRKPLRKRKYGLRKKYFIPYEDHRNRSKDYLPF